ncbi:non-ribosomal peptide synthetase [Niastella populi]|nr:non-ribosomal peptide synthetase [Niastella populi]
MNIDHGKVIALLAWAKRNGISVSVKEEQLFLKVEKGKPVDAGLMDRIRALKEDIVHFLNSDAGNFKAINTAREKILPVHSTHTGNVPLSYEQERIWLIDRLRGSTDYHLPLVLRLKGRLNIAVLEKAINAIVDRHEVLRTVIREEDGIPCQHVMPKGKWKMSYHDDLAGADALKEFVSEFINQPFDLSNDSMLRSALLKEDDDSFLWVTVVHHIASDGWSFSVMVKEYAAFYTAYLQERDLKLPELEIQYADYAIWQRSRFDASKSGSRLLYWQDRLQGALPLELPTDYSRTSVMNIKGHSLHFTIDHKIQTALHRWSKQEETTLFMTLLAAFNVLLYRYSGQNDICVGTAVANRTQRATEALIGFFVNTLVLRNQLSDEMPFRQFLQQVKRHTIEAYEYQDVPFSKLVEHLSVGADPGRHPLFQVMFNLQNTPPVPEIELGEIRMEVEQIASTASKFDLSFDITETWNGLDVRVEYSVNLFTAGTINRMVAHYIRLLKSVVANPDEQVALLPMLEPEEENRILYDFNDTEHVFPAHRTIIGLFEEQVANDPDRVALVFKDNSFTNKEIDEQANRVAAYLIHHEKISKGDLVGIKLDRSEWLIMVMLGVLKAACVYVPVDTAYPQERIDYILQDSACKVLIDEDWLKVFKEQGPVYAGAGSVAVSKPEDLMYVMYTSGSTGKPKGVMVPHKGVVNRLQWMWTHYAFTSQDVILQKTTFTFDVSVWEIFMPLCWGAKMILCDKEDIASPPNLISLIEKHGVTCMHFVPGMLLTFIDFSFNDEGIAVQLKSLQKLITSGEALPVEVVRRWYDKVNIPIHNLYGPTEASVDVTYYATTKHDTRILIGRPVWNTQMYILDAANRLLPVGVPGEICIGGTGLAYGYWNKPALTAEKFIANPFKPGERIYKTGDAGRWLPDGNIEFLGRKDNQVKIRGYRIEPEEIESALLSHPAIGAAAVIARESNDLTKELVAYVVSQTAITATGIRDYLGKTLPAYMIPAYYVQLEQLPRTPNGKIDRKGLPDPQGQTLATGFRYEAPSNNIEEELVLIWKEVLGKDTIGIRDNFFGAGGNSLKLVKMVSMINKRFNENIPVVTAFTLPNIKALADYLYEHGKKEESSSVEDIERSITMMEDTIYLFNKNWNEG